MINHLKIFLKFLKKVKTKWVFKIKILSNKKIKKNKKVPKILKKFWYKIFLKLKNNKIKCWLIKKFQATKINLLGKGIFRLHHSICKINNQISIKYFHFNNNLSKIMNFNILANHKINSHLIHHLIEFLNLKLRKIET